MSDDVLDNVVYWIGMMILGGIIVVLGFAFQLGFLIFLGGLIAGAIPIFKIIMVILDKAT